VAAGKGLLVAGAAVRALDLGPAPVIGGFPRWRWAAEGVLDPVTARAVVLGEQGVRVALVSVEILLIPEALEEAVRARLTDLKLDALVLSATHTHAGPGGYWDSLVGGRAATGPYDPAAFARLVDDLVAVVRSANAATGPASLSVQSGDVGGLVRNRNGGRVGGRLLVARLTRPSGEPVAELVRFTAHPTFLGKSNRLISGDWPGRLLASGVRGPRLFFQGSIGDQSVRLPPGAVRTGEAEHAAYARLLDDSINVLATGPADASPRLAAARARVDLPRLAPGAVPHLLWPATRTLLGGVLPSRATVTAIRLGPVLLVATPAEATETVGIHWRLVAGADSATLSLSNGYVGYVVTEEEFGAGISETGRTYYGPDLDARLTQAIAVASRAADGLPAAAVKPR
jgi:neutral ceramidase